MKQTMGYFDVDIDYDELVEDRCMIEEIFYLRDLKQRKMYLTQDIEMSTVEGIARNILQYNREDIEIPVEERKPILLYVSSCGGSVDAGFYLIDVIENSKTPVYTINTGFQYSMGFLIGLSGKKRFATANAKYLWHDGQNFVYNSGAKVQDQIAFQRRVEDRIKTYITTKSKITPKQYDKMYRTEWYMFADEAKENGVVDMIVGVDCDIDAIV